MIYVIERHDTKFHNSKYEIVIGNKIFDVIESFQDTALHNISDYVFDDNYVIVKSAMINETDVKQALENTLGVKVSQMLYG
jgi:hypothetical protein